MRFAHFRNIRIRESTYPMRDQHLRPSGRRSRRGGRAPRRKGRRSGHDSQPVVRAPKKPKLRTLWGKIVAFFSGSWSKPAQHASSNGRSSRKGSSRRGSQRKRRKPEVVEVTSPKLYVGNLSFDATESDLFDLFNGVGSVQSAEVVSHRDTQRSKGFAFVMMTTTDEAQRAVDDLHDREFMGRKLVVSGAKTSDLVHCR